MGAWRQPKGYDPGVIKENRGLNGEPHDVDVTPGVDVVQLAFDRPPVGKAVHATTEVNGGLGGVHGSIEVLKKYGRLKVVSQTKRHVSFSRPTSKTSFWRALLLAVTTTGSSSSEPASGVGGFSSLIFTLVARDLNCVTMSRIFSPKTCSFSGPMHRQTVRAVFWSMLFNGNILSHIHC